VKLLRPKTEKIVSTREKKETSPAEAHVNSMNHSLVAMLYANGIPEWPNKNVGNISVPMQATTIPKEWSEMDQLRLLNFEIQRRDSLIYQQQNRIVELEKALSMDKNLIESLFNKFQRNHDPIPTKLPKWATSKQSRYWTEEEHQKFLEAIEKFGIKNSKSIADFVGTRTPTQVRTHAQKFFKKKPKNKVSGISKPKESIAAVTPGQSHFSKISSNPNSSPSCNSNLIDIKLEDEEEEDDIDEEFLSENEEQERARKKPRNEVDNSSLIKNSIQHVSPTILYQNPTSNPNGDNNLVGSDFLSMFTLDDDLFPQK